MEQTRRRKGSTLEEKQTGERKVMKLETKEERDMLEQSEAENKREKQMKISNRTDIPNSDVTMKVSLPRTSEQVEQGAADDLTSRANTMISNAPVKLIHGKWTVTQILMNTANAPDDDVLFRRYFPVKIKKILINPDSDFKNQVDEIFSDMNLKTFIFDWIIKPEEYFHIFCMLRALNYHTSPHRRFSKLTALIEQMERKAGCQPIITEMLYFMANEMFFTVRLLFELYATALNEYDTAKEMLKTGRKPEKELSELQETIFDEDLGPFLTVVARFWLAGGISYQTIQNILNCPPLDVRNKMKEIFSEMYLDVPTDWTEKMEPDELFEVFHFMRFLHYRTIPSKREPKLAALVELMDFSAGSYWEGTIEKNLKIPDLDLTPVKALPVILRIIFREWKQKSGYRDDEDDPSLSFADRQRKLGCIIHQFQMVLDYLSKDEIQL